VRIHGKSSGTGIAFWERGVKPSVVARLVELAESARLRRRAEGFAIVDTMKDGTEIWFCGEVDGEYVGWMPRKLAEARGYEPNRTEPDADLLALLVEIVLLARDWERMRNALEAIRDMRHVGVSSAGAHASHVELLQDLARVALDLKETE
jgi:hypothetical protein